MNRRILTVLAGALMLAAVGLPSAAQAKTSKTKAPKVHYYLALGDSLAQGMQPNIAGVTGPTNQGYADDLYAAKKSQVRNLKLVKLGCGGESSASFVTGKGNNDAAFFHCHPAGGSQLIAAERFLKAHHAKGEVPLITLDIGANDVDGCAAAANVGTCVTAGMTAINTYVPQIVSGLKKAAPKGTKFAGMNLYDPVLGGYFSTDSSVRGLALASPALLKEVNTALGNAYQGGGFVTADVADAFDSYDSTDTVTWENQQIPINLARVCAWTWACSTPPSGPNIHANKNGYQVIANTFSQVIGRLS
jgi:lysophospholipase L1-like esterase